MATKDSFSRREPFPHADLNPLLLLLPHPSPLCLIAATKTFSHHPGFTGSRNVHLVRESTLQVKNRGLRGEGVSPEAVGAKR